MKKYIAVISILLMGKFSFSQNKNLYGLILPTESDLEEIPFLAGSSLKTLEPMTTPIDMSPYMPPIQDQKEQSSCVAFCLAYYLRTLQECNGDVCNFSNENNSLNERAVFSPAYLYNSYKYMRRPLECENGMAFKAAFDIISQRGYCFWSDYPYDGTQNGCYTVKIPQLNYCTKYSNVGFGRIPIDLMNIRKRLFQGYPVIMGIKIDNKFYDEGLLAHKNNKVYTYRYNGNLSDYHAVLCIGFNDQTKMLKFANSQGRHWGNEGYFYLPYSMIDQTVRECYISWTISPDILNKNLHASEDIERNGSLRIGHNRISDNLDIDFAAYDTVSNISLWALKSEDEFTYVPIFDGEFTKITNGNIAYNLQSENTTNQDVKLHVGIADYKSDDNTVQIDLLIKSDLEKLRKNTKPTKRQNQLITDQEHFK